MGYSRFILRRWKTVGVDPPRRLVGDYGLPTVCQVLRTVLLENFVGPVSLCSADAGGKRKSWFGRLETSVAPESRRPSATLFAVPPSQGYSSAVNFPAALLLCCPTFVPMMETTDRRQAVALTWVADTLCLVSLAEALSRAVPDTDCRVIL